MYGQAPGKTEGEQWRWPSQQDGEELSIGWGVAPEGGIVAEQKSTPNTRLPVELTLTIASAQDAIEYWLTHVVLKEEVAIEKVDFDTHENLFSVKLKR